MSGLQEWRDRCARAMGWREGFGHPLVDGHSPDECFWDSPNSTYSVPYEAWAPDEDANQAFLMRDECARRGLHRQYTDALLGRVGYNSSSDILVAVAQPIAFATPRQIADAALAVCEAAGEG